MSLSRVASKYRKSVSRPACWLSWCSFSRARTDLCLVMSFWLKVCIYSHTRGVKLGLGLGFMQTSQVLPHRLNQSFYIYIYAFSRRFYPKRLTLHSSYSFTFLSALAFPGNRTHDLGVASTMLYHLSYRKAFEPCLIHRGIVMLE